MKNLKTVFIFIAFLCSIQLHAQVPGFIYKQSTNSTIRAVLDPNGDGFISASSTGFVGTDYGAQSELKMISLPIIGAEPTGDVSTGGSGSHTDIVSNTVPNNQSAYVLYKKVGNEYYLIFRFRLGGASTASKGYSILFDTDGVFGNQYPSVPDNPGFEKEVVMESGPSGRVSIYNHNNNGATLATSFPLDEYSQRSVALTTVNGNTDYFYDFCVPYPSLDLAFDPVRTISVTITSANSGLVGTKADFNGINDKLYGNDPAALASALINSCPAVSITNLVEGYVYPKIKSLTPAVNGGITETSTSISGTSGEDNGTIVEVFKNGVSIGITTVSANAWTLTGVSGLAAGDQITAKVTGVNKNISDLSSSVVVSRPSPCYTNRPVISSISNGQREITVQWSAPNNSSISSNSVAIKIYDMRTGAPVALTGTTPSPAYIVAGTPASTGSVTISTGMTQSVFAAGVYYATATVNGCESRFSDVFTGTNGYTATTVPTITTTSIVASSNVARSVTVQNNVTSPTSASIYLYNGQTAIAGPVTVAANATYTFTYTGFAAGDSIYARALANNILSDRSNILVVQESSTPSATPVITGSYNANDTYVSGTSTELAGTLIKLFSNGLLLGTTTVNAAGYWSVTGLNLTLLTGQTLTATADAVGKAESVASAGKVIAGANNTIPVVTGPISIGATSVTGTGGSGTITVYVDGAAVGVVNNVSGSWTLSNIPTAQLYRGGVVTATTTISGIQSAPSSPVTIDGATSFEVTDINGNPLSTAVAGVPFSVRLVAKNGSNTYTAYSSSVNVTSSNAIFSVGSGATTNFSSGVLANHSIALTTAGSTRNITVMNPNDPGAVGAASITINANTIAAVKLNQPADITPNQSRAQYTITLTDAYGNPVIAAANTSVVLTSNINTGTFYTADIGSGTQISSITIPAGSSTATVYFNASVAGTYTITAASGVLTSASDQIVAGFIWQGDISADWGTAGNWEGNVVPNNNDEVIVANKVTYWPALDGNKTFQNLQIASNATLDLNGKTLTITGVLSGTGKFIGGGNSSLIFTGTGPIGTIYFDQSVDGTSNKLQSLTINRTSGGLLTLGGNLRVGDINFTNGIIDINDANVFITGTAVGNAGSYLRTSGTGLVKRIIGQSSFFLFPVGNANFNPVKVTNNTNVANDEFGAQVIDEVYQDGTGRGNSNKVSNKRVMRTWEITKASSGNANGSGVDMEFYWNDGDVLTNTNVSNLNVYHYTRGSGWGKQTGAHTRDAANKKVGYTGYTGSFSPFSLQDETGNLPVVWGGFTAKYQSGGVVLNWITLTEIDSKEFLVQHSEDGVHWNIISTIPAKGNSRLSNAYSFIHNYPTAGVNYYRIVEKSFTEALQYSSIVSVNVPVEGALILYGNPVSNGLLKFNLPKANLVSIIDLQGKLIFEEHRQAGINKIELTSISKGTYILRSGQENVKFIIQ